MIIYTFHLPVSDERPSYHTSLADAVRELRSRVEGLLDNDEISRPDEVSVKKHTFPRLTKAFLCEAMNWSGVFPAKGEVVDTYSFGPGQKLRKVKKTEPPDASIEKSPSPDAQEGGEEDGCQVDA